MSQAREALAIEEVAELLANQFGMRRGCPPIKNCLAFMPSSLAADYREDAKAVLDYVETLAEQRVNAALEDKKRRIEFLEEQITGMWHGDSYEHLHDALGLTWEQYQEWVTPCLERVSGTPTPERV